MANEVEIMTNRQMVNALQGSRQPMGIDPNYQINGQACLGSDWPNYQYITHCGCSYPALEKDEDLLLNVIRRNPKIKTKVLKVALAALLADLERSKEKANV